MLGLHFLYFFYGAFHKLNNIERCLNEFRQMLGQVFGFLLSMDGYAFYH